MKNETKKMLPKELIVDANYRPEGYHKGCGFYGTQLLESFDESKWEICARCGEELREVRP